MHARCTPVEIQVEEYHHYNSQKAGEPLFLLAPSGPSVPRAVDTATDALPLGRPALRRHHRGRAAFDELDADGLITMPPGAGTPHAPALPAAAQLVGYHLGWPVRAASAAAERVGMTDACAPPWSASAT